MSSSPLLNLPQFADGTSLPDAAAAWAAAGWRVHPCSPQTKRPLLAKDKDHDSGKPIDGTGWGSKATSDVDTVRGFWKKWPKAMVGIATGDDRVFVVDFDPRHDDATGVEWTLEQLKIDTEAAIGCALPVSVTSKTQSGGVHLWLRWPDDGGEPIRNRGNLPPHVDVRGVGGFVVAAPSVMATGGRYRWLKGRAPGEVDLADAPAELVALLRSRAKDVATNRPAGSPPATYRPRSDDPAEAAQRKYALAALDAECERIRSAASGQRNPQLNSSSFSIAQLVAAGVLDEGIARASIEAAANANPGRDDAGQLRATIDSGWNAGLAVPKDMSGVGQNARRQGDARGERAGHRPDDQRSRSREEGHGLPRQRPAPARGGARRSTLPNGKVAKALSRGEQVALIRRGGAWLRGRLANLPPCAGGPDALTAAREAGERLAYGIGRKLAADMIAPLVASIGLWAIAERVTAGDDAMRWHADEARWVAPVDPQGAAVWEAAREGFDRPDDPAAWLLDIRSAGFPMTDMGNAERFIARFADDFRFTTAKGWMGWDGRRWRVLDQENDVTPAQVMAAVFTTVRAIQDEARIIGASGTRDADGLDHFVPAARGKFALKSAALEDHGRSSESAGRIGCIANLAKRWLTVSIEDFDVDPFAINCLNGTIRIERAADGSAVAVRYDHDRADLMSKLAPVVFDPDAHRPASPLFTGLIEWAQPDPATLRYVQQWMGYSASGHVGAQILHFWYGLGGNGKSAVIDVVCAALGDYSDTIGIETFLDQGIKKRGDAATPDLAKLGGVRMLRASEPERGAKLNAGLVKAATGGEPMSVRALHKGFFSLSPAFKLTMAGNHRPDIPDTDEGIWRRVKLVPWDQAIAEADKDLDLVDKIKGVFAGVDGELDGVFAWLIDGLLDWRVNGFVESAAVREATTDYREDSDPLARFLRLCTEKAAGERVQSSVLHAVFCAWAKAAGETEWKQKGFTQAMKAKGYENKASNGMQFLDLRLIRQAADFVDADGHVLKLEGGVTGDAGWTATAPADDLDADYLRDDPGFNPLD